MDIWETLYEKARGEYHPEDVTPFIHAHHVVCALESADGRIYTGFCIESCCGVMDLCAERTAALNMYMNSGQTQIRRLIAFRDRPPFGGESGIYADAYNDLAEDFYSIPAADVAPVVHGLWEREPSSYWRWTPSGAVAVTRTTYRCGLCGRGTAVKSNYCPNCGAKMDGGDNDAAD